MKLPNKVLNLEEGPIEVGMDFRYLNLFAWGGHPSYEVRHNHGDFNSLLADVSICPFEFYGKRIGYKITRYFKHTTIDDKGFNHRDTIGFSLSEQKADKIAYRKAKKLAVEIARQNGLVIKDTRNEDLEKIRRELENLEGKASRCMGGKFWNYSP